MKGLTHLSRLARDPRSSRPDRIKRRSKARDEASNSFALFIIMAPVIFGAFGVGLDISRNVYIRTELQNSLDMATVAGAAVTTVDANGNAVIDTNNALTAVEKVYAMNRAQGPALACAGWGPGNLIAGTTLRECWQVNSQAVTSRSLYYSVKERSTNAFLPIIGVKYQTYDIVSQARIKQAAQ